MALRKQLADSFQEKYKEKDFWFSLLLFASLGLIFWPFTAWLIESAHTQGRILNAIIIQSFAILSLAYFNRLEVKDPLSLNPPASKTLTLAYLCLLTAFFLSRFSDPAPIRNLTLSISSIVAYCSGLTAFALFIFGDGMRRICYTACATFATFITLSMFMGTLDWPLRTFAGIWSGKFLGLLGKSVELGIAESAQVAPRLILFVDQQPFHVASECNGFGVILTSLLIGLMLALYRRTNLTQLSINMLLALLAGFAFNILRIVIIVLLAPYMMAHYDLMHEVVGVITFWTCLIWVWVLMGGPTRTVTN
jgi:exosortase/archaeosortase family protein